MLFLPSSNNLGNYGESLEAALSRIWQCRIHVIEILIWDNAFSSGCGDPWRIPILDQGT